MTSAFEFPPFYQLPPFFTIQQNAGVRNKQFALWKQLVLDYCAHSRTFMLDVADSAQDDIFKNSAIQRQLTAEGRRTIAQHLIQEGVAAWADSSDASRLLIFWRSPSEWGDLVLRWAEELGRIGSVETVYSLIEGDDTEGEEFYGIPRELMMVALQELVKRRRAEIFRGKTTGSEGVK